MHFQFPLPRFPSPLKCKILAAFTGILLATFARAEVSYRGFYSGTLATGGHIGFYVTANDDVTIIVVDPLSNSFGASNNLKLDAAGGFTASYSIATITGQIAADGNVTGNVAPIGLSFTAHRSLATGTTAAYDGFYQGWIFDPNNRLLTLGLAVSADGQLFAFIQDGPTVVDAGYGTIDARGIFSWRDSAGRVSSGSIITTAGGLAWNGRFSKTGVGSYTFVAARKTAAHKLINIATRGRVEAGDGALIAGFVIEGGAKTILIRGVGPGLTQLGVPDALADPILTLFEGADSIAANNDWNQAAPTTSAAEIRDASNRVGAFTLAENSRDAVLLLRLEPGSYTARLSGAANGTGIGLIEVYEVQ